MADLSDDELLALVNSEHDNSIGFELDAELSDQRERALKYFNGEMTDVPSLPNRSNAVSLDVADAIETLLPDVVDVLTSGDDILAFRPTGPEDEEAAQQETDVVKHVIYNENPGWLLLTTAAKDALQAKTGVFKWRWVEGAEKVEEFEGKNAIEVQTAMSDTGSEVFDVELDEDESLEAGEERYKFKVKRKYEGCVKVETVAPEDLTVARDTVWIQDATYVATRSRPRVQDLIAEGIDPAKLERLPSYIVNTEAVSEARDTVDESMIVGGDTKKVMRQVEVIEHYVRVTEGDETKIYVVLTGGTGQSRVLLRKQEANRIQLSAITPYLVPHRFYGQSPADKLIEVQKIRTALTRAMLDSAYFALNQRVIVAENGSTANTIPDLLRNEPGVPIRARSADAVVALQAGGLGFEPQAQLEYFATEAEKRTGIVRNAQGLNPDTLHDTAKGAQMLMTSAQKRVRMIIRTFAETGIKDLYLGVHALLREHSTQEKTIRLRNKWVPVMPSSWSARNDMTIEVGRGAAETEYEMAMMDKVISMQAEAMGAGLPIVKPKNIYASAIRMTEKAGFKNAESYWSNPEEEPPQPPQPDPKVMEIQAKANADQAKMAGEMKMKAEQSKADMELARYKADLDIKMKRDIAFEELALKRAVLFEELKLKREEAAYRAAVGAKASESQDIGNVTVGGEAG